MERSPLRRRDDFTVGPVWRRIMTQAVPLTVAQLVHLLYNIVDRIYIGHIEGGDGLALTGIGLTFPIVTMIMAFTALFGMGGVPLFSIASGGGNHERARRIQGTSFALLLGSSVLLMLLGYLFCEPVLFAFGASEASFVHAQAYLHVYLLGTVFSMLSTGMNGYISAQGFPAIGMLSTVIGAGMNLLLDPIFIFALDLGVSGAALATVISQAISAAWVLRFLFGKKAIVPLRWRQVRVHGDVVGDILKMGTSNFVMQGTNCLVQVACNATLQTYGGDLYVGVMVVANSIRDVFTLPVNGIVSGSQPVISYNYGAGRYERVKAGIRFHTIVGSVYTLAAWLLVLFFPKLWFGIFSDDLLMMEAGADMLQIYFFGFVFMALQFAGQSTFQALGDARHAIFFSLLRKAFIVVPLTLLLPRLGLGVTGVFLAEPISNIIGGVACYLTMRMTVYRRLKS